jgi:hypothetical protein
MALDLDGYRVLRQIGENPEAFAGIAAEARKAARGLLMKHLKAKSTDLNAVRGMRKALRENFDLLLEAMTDSGLKTVAMKLDKNNADLKTASVAHRRERIKALASAAAEPVLKTPKGARKKEVKPLRSLAIAATTSRKG